MKAIIVAIATASLLWACTSNSKPDDQAFLASLDSANANAPVIDEQVITSILEQIPSPLETSVQLKQSGTKYDERLLNMPDNVSRYNSNFSRALNLGIYGTDLGYTNIYEQKIDGIHYLSAIKTLAKDLGIGQYFDIEMLGKLAANSKNLDSLMLITTQNFNAINKHLQNEDRASVSVLLLAGGWLEAMEIICQVANNGSSNEQLKETIGAQKIILEQLVLLLSFYESDPQMAELSQDFKQLQTVFDTIKITYTYKESTMEIVDGVAVIKDNSTTTVDITDQNVSDIQKKVNTIRTKITS
ncbi:MAG TPA: hypothetical protein VFE50_04500 [Cyclobacteriaceae bacterium]|nr:hypothetical protein [Cyclobacteriaceae bacterium]